MQPFPSLSRTLASVAVAALLCTGAAHAGGTLTIQGSSDLPIQILDHHVEVLIQNGFARVEVTQSFFNPNGRPLEAVYRVPVPIGASLSEMTMFLGETVMEGEVVPRDEARAAYEEERESGAGLAEEQEGEAYDFHVSPVPALDELRFRYLYYQPLKLDTGVGRFLYPLEDGGTDELAKAFWTQESEVLRSFSFHAVVDSVWPIVDVRMPGFSAAATVKQTAEGRWDVLLEAPGGVELTGDLILYYRLADDLPGRVEMLAYRPDTDGPGTFMLVLTPGIDLAPLTSGVDYVFVLDVSGSMEGKLGTLAAGVAAAIGELRPEDRFRIVTFSGSARDLTRGYRNATEAEVGRAVDAVSKLGVEGGTNLYEGIRAGLDDLDADRATSVVLVTDAVANEGIVDPERFDELMRQHDVRLFGFLMGNNANWPLMRTITEASGGFYAQVSNADDVLGQILLAKSKVTHAALHAAELSIRGVRTHDAGLGAIGKVYRGQQLVAFGRYDGPGRVTVELRARLTGEDEVYATEFEFPAVATDHPELERLWALDRIDAIQLEADRGHRDSEEAADAVRDLGVAYQLVTDETSMLVLRDESFERRGIERSNRERVAIEREAQAQRVRAGSRSRRVDTERPAFPGNAPRTGGGGAFGPAAAALAVLLAALGARRRAIHRGEGRAA
jgi:Ca-activated chloride channel family protein